jgi:hypothetical protein
MMPKYRVKPGCYHGSKKQYGPGSIVELTEQEAAAFLDKLVKEEPAKVEQKPAEPEPEARPPAQPPKRRRK